MGPRGRSAFLTEVVGEAVNRRKLLEFLSSKGSMLGDADYPEFKHGAEAWVRESRAKDVALEHENLLAAVGTQIE